ncbi:lysylphosphatidylglycerol synthase domain-containing protein [Pannus brasiliensis CCIBt3594]|uniref:Lysylphosphatidylglycerol synthase domain-containing protein n=1 Tax=Pannus brasiliensis CCIBt3594 TaxID=1427578 RepID=A0AAW9QYR0_9CHRO
MKRLRQFIPIAIALVLFVLAVGAITEEFKHYTFAELVASFNSIPTTNKFESIVLMVLGYLSMAGYDLLGFHYIDRWISLGRIVQTSFISYALGNTIGMTIFSGTAIRYRFYSPAGVGTMDIARVIGFTHFSFWLGMLGLGGVVYLFDPLDVPKLLRLPFETARPVGAIFLGILVVYFFLAAFVKKPLRIANEEFSLPSLPLSIGLIVVSFVDWALAAGVLYVLLPDHYPMSFMAFFALYVFAMTAGVISNVPGGAGVFELIMLKLRPETVSQPDLLGALIAYRGVYYLLPLLVAVTLLIGYEIQRKTRN